MSEKNIIRIAPFSDTHKLVCQLYKKYKINVLEGAVRSGKSFLVNFLFLDKLEYKTGAVIISGNTADTVKKNVVGELENKLNVKIKFRNNAFGEYFQIPHHKFKNLTFYCVGGGKEGDEKKVQGMTVLGWLADEAATYHKNFFEMMLTRLSREDSFAFLTLNPDKPNHWLKIWLDNQTDESSKTYVPWFVKTYKFKLDDNYSLPESYKAQIKNSVSGFLYRRLVLGEWAIGEGLVYSANLLQVKSDQEIMEEISYSPYKHSISHRIGVDLGTSHPSSFIYIQKVGNKFYILDEYYKEKIAPSQLAQDLNDFKKKYILSDIFYDHAALWFFEQMKKDYPNLILQKAKKDVNPGIAFIEMLILTGRLVISKKCKNLINEFESYSWSPKTDGEVIKEKDDALDALRYGIFSTEYNSKFY